MVNLFKGYMVAQDTAFVEFIKDHKNKYEIEGIDMTPEQLMQLAEIKYKALKQSNQWNAPTKEQQEIVALKAQLADYKKGALQLSKHLQKQKSGPSGGGHQHRKRGNNQTNAGTTSNTGNLPWWKTPPKPGESSKKVVKGKTLHWCAWHKKWVGHPSHKCRLPKESNQADKDKEKATSSNVNKEDKDKSSKRVSFATQIRNMIEEMSDEEQYEQAST
jgi:hypothetical protein